MFERSTLQFLVASCLIAAGCGYAGRALADAVGAVNHARSSDCAGTTILPPLREDRALDAAARRLAHGATLHEALHELVVRPASATALHVSAWAGDRGITKSLAGHYCRVLASTELETLGVASAGGEVWIIVAAPLPVPRPDEHAAVAERILERINAARAAPRRCGARTYGPAAPLKLSGILSSVATGHSADMAAFDDLEHEDRDGTTPADRVRRAGYAARLVGENVASGVPNADEVVRGWLSSPGHCANIMDGRFTEMGVAFAVAPRTAGGIYWTQLLAQPR